ncbi:MAG: hypothetical protein BWY77_01991 [bacterium ADurb.Bin431]|nr:MAG: hypothetical protein BWY77_01991 [bacterium ADurb.Bin431]
MAGKLGLHVRLEAAQERVFRDEAVDDRVVGAEMAIFSPAFPGAANVFAECAQADEYEMAQLVGDEKDCDGDGSADDPWAGLLPVIAVGEDFRDGEVEEAEADADRQKSPCDAPGMLEECGDELQVSPHVLEAIDGVRVGPEDEGVFGIEPWGFTAQEYDPADEAFAEGPELQDESDDRDDGPWGLEKDAGDDGDRQRENEGRVDCQSDGAAL